MRTVVAATIGTIVASLGGIALPNAAHAQALPAGSWQNSCTLTAIDRAKGTMDATCGAGVSDDDDDEWYISNVGFQYSDCTGDISNQSAQLSCAIDQNKLAVRLKKEADAKADADASAAAKAKADAEIKYQLDSAAQVAAATPGLRAAASLILGKNLGNDEVRKLVAVARSFAYPESRQAVQNKTFDFGSASTFLKKYLARSGGEKYRNGAVDAAFMQVYGRKSTAAEQIGYYNKISAGTAWYATIVTDEIRNIPAAAPVRKEIAQRVAQLALGRDPLPAELQKWTASGQNFGTLVEGVRQQFWSGGNADELILTVQRALTKLGRPTDDAGVKAAVTAWRPMRAIYAQMVGPVGKAKLMPTVVSGMKLFGN